VHEWTKTVAVVLAALWGGYTFLWKEILVPSWAPASLVIEVKPRQAGFASTRTLYLLPSVWWATGMQRTPAGAGQSFESEANAVLREVPAVQAERGQELLSTGVVATGRLFSDDQILPGETVSRDLSIPLPRSDTLLALQWLVPALTRKPPGASGTAGLFAGRSLGWAYREKSAEFYPVLCKGSDQNIQCYEEADGVLEKEILRFDPRAVIFSKTLFIND